VRLTLVLGLVMAIGPLAVDMYLPAMPTLQKEFAVDAARVQHTLSAYLLGLAIGQLGFGPVADRYGRKAPLIGGLLVFTLASAACVVAMVAESMRDTSACILYADSFSPPARKIRSMTVIPSRYS